MRIVIDPSQIKHISALMDDAVDALERPTFYLDVEYNQEHIITKFNLVCRAHSQDGNPIEMVHPIEDFY